VRFLIDAPLSPQTAAWLAAQGHEAIHVETLGLLRAADEEILRRAAADQRLVITMDLDFPEIAAARHLARAGAVAHGALGQGGHSHASMPLLASST